VQITLDTYSHVLPWTNAEYEQLVGRIYRQGQKAHTVDVVIPITYATVNGERWSYCESKLRRIEYKRSIADAAVDGAVPEGNLRTPAQAQRDVMSWLDRLDRGETAEVVRVRIVVPLSDADSSDVKRRHRKYGDFSTMNARWNTSKSVTLAERLEKNPEEWQQYHTLYRKARESGMGSCVSHFPQTGSGVMYFALRAEKPVSTVALSVSGDSDSPHFSHVAFWLYRFLDAGVGLARNATYLTPYSRLVPARIAHLGRAEDTTARLGALAPGRALAPALHHPTRPPCHHPPRGATGGDTPGFSSAVAHEA
jgi:hypothetical protein